MKSEMNSSFTAKAVKFASTVAVFLSISGYAIAAEHAGAPHWTYEGHEGPAKWGELSKDFASCSKGAEQSPIDIAGAENAALAPIVFSYKPSKIDVLNNGHTIQANYDAGSSITVDGAEYNLLQFHFHDPSEHTIAGKSYAMEAHFVHKNSKGELAVVGALIEEGAENANLKSIWENMPKAAKEEKKTDQTIDAAAILPADKSYYRYAGSLTTPPCTEGVTWLLLKTPIQMSAEQISKFKDVVKINNRPVQPKNTRTIKTTGGPAK